MIPLETLLGVASSAASSSASVVHLKTENMQHGKAAMASESASVVAGSEGSPDGGGGAASIPQTVSVQPQFIVPLQTGGPSVEPSVIEPDEAPEPKRLRVAEEEWTSDT